MITPDTRDRWLRLASLPGVHTSPVGGALKAACEEIQELQRQIADAHHDLKMAVGERFTTVNSAAFEATRSISFLRNERDEVLAKLTDTEAARDLARDIAVALEQENARLRGHLDNVGEIHNGCPNTLDDVTCPWCRIAGLMAELEIVRRQFRDHINATNGIDHESEGP